MNISPIDSVKFGEVYHKNTKYSILQNYVLREIEKSFEKVVPSDKYERSYRNYINAKGYDVLITPQDKNSICVNLLRHPKNDEDKDLKLKQEFSYSDKGVRVGVYDKDSKFNVNDVMKMVDNDIHRARKFLVGALSIPVMLGALILGAAWGISKTPVSKKVDPKVIEKAIQDSAKIAKDTIKVFE